MRRRYRSKPGTGAKPLKTACPPILNLTIVHDAKNRRSVEKVLAAILVRHALDELLEKHPSDPALKAEAARTEIPRISVKRVSKLEVMTAGELARYLGVLVARLYHHVRSSRIVNAETAAS